MSEVTEITGEGDVQLEVIEINGGTIEVIGEDKTTIEIVESTSTTNDLDISTQINIVVVDSNPSEGTSLNISEDSPTTIEIASPPVSVDIIDKILVSGTSGLSFNNLIDRPFTVDGQNRITGQLKVSGNISASGTGSFSKIGIGTEPEQALHIDGNSLINAEQYYYVADTSSGLGSDINGNIILRQNNTDLMTTEGSNVSFKMPITSSQNISSSGLLFISASEFRPPTLRNLEINPGVLVYDTASGRIYYTGSYGGEGSGDATLSFVETTVSDSLNFNGNRFILRNEAGTFNESGIPTLNVGTSGSVVNFLEAYFFPNDPPQILNGHLANFPIPPINEFESNGKIVHNLIATDPQIRLGQTLTFSTSSEYTTDAFKIHPTEGTITLNVLASESLNTDVNNFYSGLPAHKFPVKVEDSAGGSVEEDLYLRILPNQSPKIFNSRNQSNEVTNETINLTLYETSSFSESIANSNLSAIEILSIVDPEGDTVTIESGSLSDGFENDFKIIIEGNTVKLSQSKAILDFDTTPNYTFQITASDEHYVNGLDLESTSSVTYVITVIDNLNPTITPTSFNINEKSEDNFVIGNLINNGVLTDPDKNESNLGATNVTLIGTFKASSPTVSGSNLTGSFGGTSLLDPNENPISFAGNNITRKPNQFLNVDLINLYKYNLTSINTTTGVTGSSGVVSINVDNHILENILTPNQSEGNIIESSRTGDTVFIGSNGLSGTELKIGGNNNTYQNWIVTSSHGDFFEGDTFGKINEHYLNQNTGSQIYIRLKNNISGSNFLSGSIVTCSITASQDDFPTTKQFFEIPINITINESPILSLTNNTENWVNTLATQSTTLVTLTVQDPESDIINNDSFQLIGNSSTDLSASFIEGNYVIQANNTLADSTFYNDFNFTASIADEHGFRTSSISGDIALIPPTTPTSASNATTDEFIFYAIESSIKGNNVVIDDHGRIKGTQAEIIVNFANTENPTNSISSFSIDNNILAISAEGRLLRGNSPFPEEYQIDDIITANITAVDQFRNNIIIPVSVIITENQAPTFTLVRETTLISPLPSGTHIGDIKDISDAEEETVDITVTAPNHTLEMGSSTGIKRKINLTSTVAQSNTTSDFNITVVATDQFGKSTTDTITIPVAANQPPDFDISYEPSLTANNTTGIGTNLFQITNITDPEGDNVQLSIENNPPNLSLNPNTNFVSITEIVPGNTQTDTTFTGNIIANDGVNITTKPFSFTIKANQSPTFTVTPLTDLEFPLSTNDVLATIKGISDDLNDNVTFTATSTIGGVSIDTNGTSNDITKYIRLDNNRNQQPFETFIIDITGSDSYNNQTKTQVNFNVAANQGPNPFTITPIELTASISDTTIIATIEGATDPLSETITLSIVDPNFSLSSAIGPTSNIFYTPGIPGTTLTPTDLKGTIVATDPVNNNVSVNFQNIIAGNSRPFQTFTAEPNLIKPLEKDTLLGTLTYNEDDGETVSFTISDNIILTDETPSSLNNGITTGIKNVLLKETNNDPVAETINFSIIIADENDNEGENSEFSVIVDANDSPTFIFSKEKLYFKAGEYNADDTVITINNIEKGNSELPVNLSIDSNTNFYLDNASSDSANTIIQLDNIDEGSNAFIKVKNTIPGNQQTLTTHTGTITLTNGSTTSTQDFTIQIKGNDSPTFTVNPGTNLTVPINKDRIVATVTGVTDKQNYTNPNFEFDNDIPFTAFVLLIETNVGVRSLLRNPALRSTFSQITASAESTSGSGNTLVTTAQDITLGTPSSDFGDIADFTTGIPYLLSGSEVESFASNISYLKSNPSTNDFVDMSAENNNDAVGNGRWKRKVGKCPSTGTGPQVGGLSSDLITDISHLQNSDNAYIHAETTSNGYPSKQFVLRLPQINLNQTNANEKLILYYHAHGKNIGQFRMWQSPVGTLDTSSASPLTFDFYHTGSATTPTTSTLINGPKHNIDEDTFHRIECDINSFSNAGNFFIYFEYYSGPSDAIGAGGGFTADFAIDNIHIKRDNTLINKTWQSRYITASHFYGETTNTFTPQKAFDNTSNFWKAHRQADNVDGGDVTLDFDFGSYIGRNPIITKISITQDTTIYHNKYRISGSLDSDTWTPLHEERDGYSTSDRDRNIQIDNTNGYKFYRITADKDNNNDSTDGPGLKSTIFYETPAVADTSVEEISQTYIIVTQSFNDTTNWNVIYNDDTPEINVGEIVLDIKIEDKYGNSTIKPLDLNYTDNEAPTFEVTSASFVIAPNEIQSPITVSQQIATIENIIDLENEDPYTCSVFTDSELTTASPNFVASTGSNTDTTSFFITCSSEYTSPLNTSLTLYVKVEDNFGSFNSQQLTYKILGDNTAPTVDDTSFEINEFISANILVGQLTATNDDLGPITFAISNNYTETHPLSDGETVVQVPPFNINSSNGNITTNVIPTASNLNTFNDGGTFKHPLIVTATDQYGVSSGDKNIFILVIPNTPPTFISSDDLGSFDEFINAGSSIASLSATDFEGDTVTFETSSTYTNADLTKIAVDCSSDGNLTFRIKASESMHTDVDNTRHEFDIDAIDEHGARTPQTFFFSIIPNLAPTFHEGSPAGALINGITYTAPDINEDETAHTESVFYSDSNAGNTITIDSASGTPTDSGSYWTIHNNPLLSSVEFHQQGNLEFDTHPTFTFIISASDNHYQSGDDPDAFIPLTVTLNLAGANDPLFENDISGVNEFSSDYATAGIIGCSNFDSFTIKAFTLHQAQLEGANVTSNYTSIKGTSLTNPGKDPFTISAGTATISRKSGVFLNSDLINNYVYSCSIENPGGNINSSFINIPITDHNPGTKTNNGPFNIIESAINSDFVFTETEGFGTNVSNVTFSPPAGFTNGYSFEVSSSNQFFNQNPNNGTPTVLEFQLVKDLSGSDYIFPENIAINYTASLIGFETSKLFGTLTATITSNSAPPLTSQSFTNNWNDVDASTAVNATLVQLTVGSDPEGDAFDPDSFILTPTTNLTSSINGNQIDIIPKTSLTVGSSPYPYTASVADIHGFRTSSVSGSIAIVFGDTGSLASSSLNMYVLDTAIGGDNVTSDSKGIGNNQSSLYNSADTVTLSVNYNEPTSQPVNFTSPTATGRFNIVNGVLFVNNIVGLPSPIVETVHFTSATQTPHSGSITVNIITNQGPTVTFTQEENLQHPITAGTVLGTITIEDDEGFNTSGVSVSDSTNFITQVVNNGLYNLVANQTLNSSVLTFNFTLTAGTTFGPSTTTTTKTLTISPLSPTGGTLKLAYSNIDNEQFYILETAEGSSGGVILTFDSTPLSLSNSGLGNNDGLGTNAAFYNSDGDEVSFHASYNLNIPNIFTAGNNGQVVFQDYPDPVDFVYDFGSTFSPVITKYNINSLNHASYFINYIKIYGSNISDDPTDGSWNLIDTSPSDLPTPTNYSFINTTPYRYYKLRMYRDSGTYLSISEIQLFSSSLGGGSGDPVITGSSGIPNSAKAAVLSASFIGTTEINPQPEFSTNSDYFNILNSNGLGYLQVNENFRSQFDDGFEGSSTQEQIFVTCSTAGTTMANKLASITPITINIVKNNGPSIIVGNKITSLLSFADENPLCSLSFNDSEGDYPVSYVISAVSFTGGTNSVIKTEDLTGTVSDSSAINIRGNANLVNSPGGTITFTITATDLKGKISTLSPTITVTGGLIFNNPTLGTNSTAYIIETGVDNNPLTTNSTGIAGTNFTLSATYDGVTLPNVNESLTQFSITSPNYLEVHNTNKVRLKLNGGQELEDLGFNHDSSAQTVTVQITTTKDTGGTYTTNGTFSLNITENFPPEIDIDEQTQTLGVNFNDQVYMSASNGSETPLSTTDPVYQFSISDAESNTPINVQIINQISNIGGINLLSFNDDGTTSTTINLGSSPSTITIHPTSTTVAATTAQNINFGLQLTDSKGKTRTYSSTGGDFNQIVIQDPPPVVANYGRVYVYTSTFGTDSQLQTIYLPIMGAESVNSNIPPQVTAYNPNPSSVFQKFKTGELGNSSISLAVGSATKLADVPGLNTLDNTLKNIGTISIPRQSAQIIVVFPAGSDMTVPTSIHDSFNNVAGGAVPCINSDNNGFAINGGILHSITLDTPHEGFSEWFVFGRTSQNSIMSNFEIRLVDTNGSLPT